MWWSRMRVQNCAAFKVRAIESFISKILAIRMLHTHSARLYQLFVQSQIFTGRRVAQFSVVFVPTAVQPCIVNLTFHLSDASVLCCVTC